MQCALAGGFQPPGAVLLHLGENPLDRAQVGQHLVVEQDTDQFMAGIADFPGLVETPLRGAHPVRGGSIWAIIYGRTSPNNRLPHSGQSAEDLSPNIGTESSA